MEKSQFKLEFEKWRWVISWREFRNNDDSPSMIYLILKVNIELFIGGARKRLYRVWACHKKLDRFTYYNELFSLTVKIKEHDRKRNGI